MPNVLAISAAHARRFLVRRHLLDPPRSLPAEPESVLRVVDRLGSLQFDPLEVPGARNHDLVLHARIAGYQREWCDRWLYQPGDRRLIELYNKSLNILPMSELPHYRIAWERSSNYYRDRILREQSAVAEAILERIGTDGALSTAAFRNHNHAIDWWWAPTSAARAVMEALFVVGRLGIARRDGSRRYYDLIERLVPADLLERRAPEEEQLRHRLLSRHRGLGLMAVGGPSELVNGTGSAADRARITAGMVSDGALIPVSVEGLRETRHLLADELPILEATAGARRRGRPSVSFLPPLDPLIWDRRLTRSLFNFDYIWEVYTPERKRRHGYYVLPILFGDRLVGRLEPRFERKERALRILGVWFEPGFEPMTEPHFLAALADALAAYRSFVGARRATWPRTRPGRDLAGALRRLEAG
ncbi:MAG: winged helix DNA-binding domain-containing protein [Chloroflexota bacterium]|nr:winged helix DNA-binding domain-containing protein [Chloroflexota bacterium]